jgi:hypothetical protein
MKGRDKPVLTAFRLKKVHRRIINAFVRRDKISRAEVVRRAIENLAATNNI